MSWLMSGATLVATPFTLHRRLSSPATRLCLHPCLLGAKPRQVHRFQHARLAVRAGAPSSADEMARVEFLLAKVGVSEAELTQVQLLPNLSKRAKLHRHGHKREFAIYTRMQRSRQSLDWPSFAPP